MATKHEMLDDPDFQGLSLEDRRHLLRQYDDNFDKATTDTQNKLLDQIGKNYRSKQQRDQQTALPAPAPNGPSSMSPNGPSSTQPEPGSWWQRNIARPANDVVGRGMEIATTPLVTAARVMNGEPLTAQTYKVPGTNQSITREGALAGGPVGAGGVAQDTRQNAARVVVPQTATEAAIMAGTAVAGPGLGAAGKAIGPLGRVLAGTTNASRAIPAAARMAGATAGGALGGAFEGATGGEDTATSGALKGLLASGIGEGATYAAGKLARSVPGAAKRIADKDAARIGDTLGEVSSWSGNGSRIPEPDLAAFRDIKTANDLNRIASGPGLDVLGAKKGTGLANIEKAIRQPISVPSLNPSASMTLTEANDKLSEIGAKAFSKNPLDRTVNGVDQRRLYGQVRKEIHDALQNISSPEMPYAKAWDMAQKAYAGGRVVLDELLRNPSIYSGTGNGMTLNTSNLQKLLRDPDIQAELRAKLGEEGLDKVVKAITRGAPIGSQDILANERGPLSARSLISLLSRGTPLAAVGHAVGGLPGALVGELVGAAALPNSAARYVGKTPYALPNAVKTAVDLATEKGLSQVDTSRPGGRLRSLLGVKQNRQ